MILAGGRLYDTAEQDAVLSRLEADINRTRQTKTLTAETVITAVERLGRRLAAGDFDTLLGPASASKGLTPISKPFCPC